MTGKVNDLCFLVLFSMACRDLRSMALEWTYCNSGAF